MNSTIQSCCFKCVSSDEDYKVDVDHDGDVFSFEAFVTLQCCGCCNLNRLNL